MDSIQEKVIAANPFPGLRPFKIEESHLFFGREGQSDEVLLKLSKHRFVSVIGPSGSGKSSFIYCGVLPILYGGFLTDASPNWEVVVTRPGAGPIDNLAESLLSHNPEYTGADPEEKKIKRTIISTLLRSSSLGLVEAIEQSRRSADVNYLVLVDQFEELFRFKESSDTNSVNETLAFVNLLIEAANYPDTPIYVAITMRSDFIGDCAQFPDLTRKINDSHYLIPQLTRDQKRRAIEGPVAVGGAKITPRLVQQLLNDLGDNPDQLPILQHALMRTWTFWSQFRDYDEEPVDLKHYEAIGTMREALSLHANEAYDELDEKQQHYAEILFKAITEKRGENFGIRRPTRLGDIASIAECSVEELADIIEKFREPGRSLLTPGYGIPLDERSMIDISHESLMRIWVRLKNWVDDEAEAVQMYLRLAEAASMYQVGKAGLWRPPDLQLALNWQIKHKPTLVWGQRYHPAFERTMVFLEYSKKEWETEQRIKELEQKRKLQRARIVALVLGSAAIIAIGFLVYAIIQKTEADRQRELAEELRIVAEKNADLAEQRKDEAEKAAEDARLAEADALRQKAIADSTAEVALQQKALAEQNEERANRESDRANQNADSARAAALEAEIQRRQAEIAREQAQTARYLAQGKAMALKSQELNDRVEASLVAQQGYKFHTEHGGYEYENDIYNGLYYALKKNDDPLTRSLQGHRTDAAARALITVPGRDVIYSGGTDGAIIRWRHNGVGWDPEVLVPARTDYHVYELEISPDGRTMVAAGMNGTHNISNNYLEIYDLQNIGPAKKLSGFTGAIEDVRFAPDGSGIYVRDNSGTSIKFSDLNTVREVVKPSAKINDIDISSDGTLLAGAGDNGTLFVWDLRNNFAERKLERQNPGEGLTAVRFRPGSKQLVIAVRNSALFGILRIIPESYFETGNISQNQIRSLPGHTSLINEIRFNHAGTFMASASNDKTVRLWNMDKLNDQPMILSDHGDWVWSVTFTPDDEQLMIGLQKATRGVQDVDHSIHVWPTSFAKMADRLCNYVDRNFTEAEWELYVGTDLNYELTCPSYPDNR